MIPSSQWLIMAKMYLLLMPHVHTWISCDCAPVVLRTQMGTSAFILGRGDWAHYRWGYCKHIPSAHFSLTRASSLANLVSVGARNMVLSLVGAVDIVQTKFTLDKVNQARKVLFRAIVIGEGDLNWVCTQLHKTKGGRVLRDGMVVWGSLAICVC